MKSAAFRHPQMRRAYDDLITQFCTNKGAVWSGHGEMPHCQFKAGNSVSAMFWRGFDQAQPGYSGRKTTFTASDKRSFAWPYYCAGRDVAIWIQEVLAK